MNKKTLLAIAFLSLVSLPVFAMDYPQFGGITLNKDTTAAQYIIYFFNLAVAIGAFIAVIMVIMAGVEWVTSAGNPGKVDSAKKKIVNTLFGVCVLLGCYFILDTINPELTNIKINDLNCENGIVLSVLQEKDQKVKDVCIDAGHSNITDTIISTKKWNFPEGYLLKAYAYTGANYSGTITEFNCKSGACSGSIPTDTKSIYLLVSTPGIYLYDATDFKPGTKGYPRFTSSSVDDLAKLGSFDNFTKSIDIVNPDQTKQAIQYQAVVFDSQNWKGRCAFVAQPVASTGQATNGYYTDNVTNISSIIVSKANTNQADIYKDRGYVILYSKSNCGKSSVDAAASEIKSCSIPIEAYASGQVNVSACSEFKPGDEVMSFEITGAAGLVLSTAAKDEKNAKTYCQYFSKKDLGGGTCLSIIDTSIFTVGGDTPKSYIVIPDN